MKRLIVAALLHLLGAALFVSETGAQSYAQCGRHKQSRIVGGATTFVNEYPMMAGLVQGRAASVFCGATIVSQWYAVTAAHCLINLQPPEVRLLVGDHDLSVGTDSKYARLYGLRTFVRYPYYTGGDANDIALVGTSEPIQYNPAVGPVCLPWGNSDFTGAYLVATGWGTLWFGGRVPNQLQKVYLQVISNGQCQQAYGSRITPKQLCTWTRGRDVCQKDSGGPLFYEAGGLVYLAAIASFGTTCADNKPAVNTRITEYANWIRQYAR